MTDLVQVLYGKVEDIFVPKQLLESLGFGVQAHETSSIISISADDEIEKHVLVDHGKIKPYSCRKCSFKTLSLLKDHIMHCQVEEVTMLDLRMEMNDERLEEEVQEIIYQCSLCDLVLSSMEEMQKHMEIHCNEGLSNEEVIIEETVEELMTDYIVDETDFLVINVEKEMQDSLIETTEVSVNCEPIAESSDPLKNTVISDNNLKRYIETTEAFLNYEDPSEDKNEEEMEINTKQGLILADTLFSSHSILNEFTIESQTKKFVTDETMKRKAFEINGAANQEKNSFYCCTQCENSFDSPKALTQHVTTDHVTKSPSILPISCKHCNLNFVIRSALAKHYRDVHPGKEQIFQCPECAKSLKTAKILKRHELLHTRIKPLQCGQCQTKFYEEKALKVHVEKGCKINKDTKMNQLIPSVVVSPEDFVHSSPIQDETLGVPDGLEENSNINKCYQCDDHFGSRRLLLDHINQKHNDAVEKAKQKLKQDHNGKRDKTSKIEKSKETLKRKLDLDHDLNVNRHYSKFDKSLEVKTDEYTKVKLRKIQNNNEGLSRDLVSKASRIKKLKELKEKLMKLKSRKEQFDKEQNPPNLDSNRNEAEQKPVLKNIDIIATHCQICKELFQSRMKLFGHMLTHVPSAIRANLPKGENGWCSQCPGPVPIKQTNSHVENVHPEQLKSEDLAFVEISDDADLEEIRENGLKKFEDSPAFKDWKCLPVCVGIIPVNLAKYGVSAKDYM